MKARAELRLTLGGIVAVQLLTAFGAISLLARMGPAIEQIVAENVVSIRAVQEMTAALASAGSGDADARTRYERALKRAANNVTEAAEPEVLAVLESRGPGALARRPEDLSAVLEALGALEAINFESVIQADERAQGLGIAGAWAAAFLGFVGFGLGLWALARLSRRLVEPLQMIDAVIASVRAGDPYRRCSAGERVEELDHVVTELNALLDERQRPPEPTEPRDGLVRAALLRLLDREARPALLVDVRGEVEAANDPAWAQLARDAGEALRHALPPDEEAPPWLSSESLGGEAWLCFVDEEALATQE